MKKLIVLLTGALLSLEVSAQMTYHHDAPFMNQFLVAETGMGVLMPSLYYDALHKDYQSWAYMGNKNMLRGYMALNLSKDKQYAEKIDSALNARAEVELIRTGQRIPGALDLAWDAEKKKINKKLEMMEANIKVIVRRGGSNETYQLWQDEYNAIQKGIQDIRDAYLPLSERKQAYLQIYEDLVQKNAELCIYLCKLSSRSGSKRLSTVSVPKVRNTRQDLAAASLARWKDSYSIGVSYK